MAWVYEKAEEYNFPNIEVYRRMNDGVQSGWRIVTKEGYVMYNPNEPQIGYDEDDNEIEVFFYYTVKIAPQNYNFDNFPWVAVPRGSVNENYIFGGGDNTDHETI